jgi:hypothetical protein
MARIAIFLLVVLSVVTGVHLYFWARLVRDTDLPPPYRAWVTGAIVALAACLPLPFLVARRLSPDWARFVVWPAYVWMGFMFLLFSALVTLDVVRLFTHTASRLAAGGALDAERRTFLARLLGVLAGGTAGIAGALAVGRGLAAPVVKEVAVRLRRLPRASHGTTIVQLTDVHVGPTIGRAFVEDVVRRTNALAPDLVVITGDLVDGSVEALWDAVSALGKLRARHGVFFVTGNHEYFSGVRPWIAALERLGIRVLQNERVAIGDPEGGFDLAGVHDFSAARFDAGLGPDLPTALAGRDPSRELVLLAHQPKAIREAAQLGVGLQISGHTHGGQIWPFGYLVRLAQPFVLGLHRQGDTQIYVSAGTAYWGPPMRLGTQGEITKITLLSEAA